MEEAVDGEYQAYQVAGPIPASTFGKFELADMVATMSDDDIWRLNRGGHDPHKSTPLRRSRSIPDSHPSWQRQKGMNEGRRGPERYASDARHGESSLRAFRDQLKIPISTRDRRRRSTCRP